MSTPCRRISEWLSESPRAVSGNLPPELQSHLKECRDCRTDAALLRAFTRDCRSLEPSATQAREVQSAVFEKLGLNVPPVGEKVTRSTVSQDTGPDWLSWFQVLLRPLPAFALLLIAAALFVLFRGSGSGLPPSSGRQDPRLVGQILALGAADLRIGTASALTRFPHELPQGETVVLGGGATASTTLSFPDSGTVTFQGTARLAVARDGFRVGEGRFLATFQRLGRPYRIALPIAIMGIRGTTVRFDVGPDGSGSVEVQEGLAELLETSLPFDSGAMPIPLVPGKRLHWSNTAIALEGAAPAAASFTTPRPEAANSSASASAQPVLRTATPSLASALPPALAPAPASAAQSVGSSPANGSLPSSRTSDVATPMSPLHPNAAPSLEDASDAVDIPSKSTSQKGFDGQF